MKLLILLPFVLSSFASFARAEDGRVDADVFKPAPKASKDVPGTQILVENLPRLQEQFAWPNCDGVSAAVLVQHYICKVKGVKKCEQVPPELEVSWLSVGAWSAKNNPDEPADLPSSYASIHFGGAGVNALLNSARAFVFKPNACYSADRSAGKFKDSAELMSRMSHLESMYLDTRSGKSNCESCLTGALKADLDIGVDSALLKKAVDKPTFGEFLYKAMFGSCTSKVTVSPHPEVAFFPAPSDGPVKKPAVLRKIIETLKPDRPILMGRICLIRKSNGECKEGGSHSLVLTGYKEVTTGSGPNKKLLRVQNSWGKKWQDQFDGGWVDADALTASIGEDPVDPGTLSWYN